VLRLTREEGLSRVEYALLIILIALIIIATLVLVDYLVSVIRR
jgi:Flp pilus assembly pilin Flp